MGLRVWFMDYCHPVIEVEVLRDIFNVNFR